MYKTTKNEAALVVQHHVGFSEVTSVIVLSGAQMLFCKNLAFIQCEV